MDLIELKVLGVFHPARLSYTDNEAVASFVRRGANGQALAGMVRRMNAKYALPGDTDGQGGATVDRGFTDQLQAKIEQMEQEAERSREREAAERLERSLSKSDPASLPSLPSAPPAPDMGAIEAMIVDAVRDGAVLPLQRVLEDYDGRTQRQLGELDDALARVREQSAQVDPEQIKALVMDALKALQPTSLVVQMPAAEPVALGLVHFRTEAIIKALTSGVNVYLHGPAGSGKTTAGQKVAVALGVQFYFAAKVESEYLLLGFKDARGETVRTQFREAYEHGGCFLFDEMDASSPSAIVALNAALANGICPFPDGNVQRHTDFYCIGAGNTTLAGANRQYVGRQQLDAASVDRFAFIEFPYDEQLELAIATNVIWAKHVQAVRRAVTERGLNHLVTPRASFDGSKLLEAGFDWETVEAMVIYKGLDESTVAQLRYAVPGISIL